jgi:hypothetical protein
MPKRSKSAYNESEGRADTPDSSPFFSYDEVFAAHGQTDSMEETVNSKSGEIMGHGAPGELHASKKAGPMKGR